MLEGKRGTYVRVVSGLLEGYLEEQIYGTSFDSLQVDVGCYGITMLNLRRSQSAT